MPFSAPPVSAASRPALQVTDPSGEVVHAGSFSGPSTSALDRALASFSPAQLAALTLSPNVGPGPLHPPSPFDGTSRALSRSPSVASSTSGHGDLVAAMGQPVDPSSAAAGAYLAQAMGNATGHHMRVTPLPHDPQGQQQPVSVSSAFDESLMQALGVAAAADGGQEYTVDMDDLAHLLNQQ